MKPAGEYPTGGAGLGAVHLGSQGSVILSGDGRFLQVTNAGSNDVAVFAVHHDVLELVRTIPSNGGAPVSVTEHDSLVYVLNTGDPCLVGFTLDADGMQVVPGSRRDLAAGADPAQVGFSPDGATVVVTQGVRTRWSPFLSVRAGCWATHGRSTCRVRRRTASPSPIVRHSL